MFPSEGGGVLAVGISIRLSWRERKRLASVARNRGCPSHPEVEGEPRENAGLPADPKITRVELAPTETVRVVRRVGAARLLQWGTRHDRRS